MSRKLPHSSGEILAEMCSMWPQAAFANIVSLSSLGGSHSADVSDVVDRFCRYRRLGTLPSGFRVSHNEARDAIRDILTGRRLFDETRANITVSDRHAANVAKRFLGLFRAPVDYFQARGEKSSTLWCACLDQDKFGIVLERSIFTHS